MIPMRTKRAALLSVLVMACAACNNQTIPGSPAAPSLFTVFNGDWVGTAVLSSVTPFVSSDACVQPTFASQISTLDQLNLAISQDGGTLVARRSSSTTGLSCSYTGTTSANRIALDTASCDFPELVLRCTVPTVPPQPVIQELLDMQLIGSTIQGTILNGQLNATITDTYNTEITRTTLSYQFTAARP